MHSGRSIVMILPERVKLYLGFLRLRAGCAITTLGSLGGRVEERQTYSSTVPWLIRSAKVSFSNFKLCIASQSSESSRADVWVSLTCSCYKAETRVRQETVERHG